jgi:hypothetical protein
VLTLGSKIDYLPCIMSILQKANGFGARPLIRVKIWGNLGDQLFQYALVTQLEMLNSETVGYNDEEFWHFHRYKNIAGILRNRFRSESTPALDLLNTIKGFWIKIFFREIYISENILQIKKRKFASIETYEGHFRSDRFFFESRDILFKKFDFSDLVTHSEMNEIRSRLSFSGAVGLHIIKAEVWLQESRTRMKGECWPSTSPESFYRASIRKIQAELRSHQFFVFTDDKEWCVKAFPETEKMIFVDNFSESSLASLQLLSLCKNQILSATAFGWWAGYLNRNKDKMILNNPWPSDGS